MKNYIQHHPWQIIENSWSEHNNKVSESLCSLGNGRMGQRANFEETYTGETLQGNYVAGIYYPDKTRVGWWKNGYPEYFAKVLNAPQWNGVRVLIDNEEVDLHTAAEVQSFSRVLNMQEGYLERKTTLKLQSGKIISIHAQRFCSVSNDECGALYYNVKAVNFSGKITFIPTLNGDVKNQDANYGDTFWTEVKKLVKNDAAYIICETKKTAFQVVTGTQFKLRHNGAEIKDFTSERVKKEKFASHSVSVDVKEGESASLEKIAVVLSSENYPKEDLLRLAQLKLKNLAGSGYLDLFDAHTAAWRARWEKSDIIIEGDVAAQQGIRFNIFQLLQTYTGEDARLNIGPKGFTGEKYGGSTYWDTEAYCLPFYLSNSDEKVARNLLVYRYNHLQKAIENAEKLGFSDGAALYPMVTINGEECHNEWEITFEEIHRNGAIAYGIYDYINYTSDKKYLAEHGLEVLIGIARFWKQRITFSEQKNKFVMLGVTGPNEYENNVGNNWYTNYLAVWCLKYCSEAIEYVHLKHEARFEEIVRSTKFDAATELNDWHKIINNMYFPRDEKREIWLQQEDYLDKEMLTVADLKPEQRPINQKWSWDRILRSPFIKQADVLQGLYFFEDDFTKEEIARNFNFYEPRTVHESSLSPCVHVILACLIGNFEKANEMYLRTSRLDLDDYNNDTEDGLHITSMAGTWLAVVKGFGGMRVKDGKLFFTPNLPPTWQSVSFKVRFRGAIINLKVSKSEITIVNTGFAAVTTNINGKDYLLQPHTEVKI